MVEIHKPPNERVIDCVWVGLSEDADGKNGICASMVPGLGGAPMVTGSPQVLEYFKQQAEGMAALTGVRIKVYQFTRAECVYDSGEP